MAYEPTQWAVGDKITAAKMNKIENGIAEGGGAVVATTESDGQSGVVITSYTWQELYNIMNNGKMVLIKISNNLFTVVSITSETNRYNIETTFGTFSCFSPNENPGHTQK